MRSTIASLMLVYADASKAGRSLFAVCRHAAAICQIDTMSSGHFWQQ